jgi:DNA modification methylase
METLGPYLLDSIVLGDSPELALDIPDNSVDLIFTDPPYQGELVWLYGWLGEMAARVLKPGGFCLAMCSGLYLNENLKFLDEHLTFFWLYDIEHKGQRVGVVWPYGNNQVRIVAQVRHVAAYSKGQSLPRMSTLGLVKGSGRDKRYHVYGQDEASTRYFVDCFSDVGEIVLDPFSGGGTTAAMCATLNRRFLGFDKDPEAVKQSQERIATVQPLLFDQQPSQLRIGLKV